MLEQEFNDLAAAGYNRIPVTLETFADLDTPLSIYLKLANEPYTYLLESVQGGERFGRYRAAASPGEVVWIHAVSVGETRAAAPLIERLERERPQASIVLTAMTAAGREAGRALYGDRVVQAWLPYDLPFAVASFLAHFHPRAGILVETELWPNLVRGTSTRGIPVYLVNARLSARSARGYARLGLRRISYPGSTATWVRGPRRDSRACIRRCPIDACGVGVC